jgi:hypothetical protein
VLFHLLWRGVLAVDVSVPHVVLQKRGAPVSREAGTPSSRLPVVTRW